MEYIVVVVVIFFLIVWLARSNKQKTPAESEPVAPANSDSGGSSQTRNDDIVSIVDPLDDEATIRRSFRLVFAMLTADRQAALIAFYRRQHGVDEIEAMKIAILDRQRDEDRYR